jgi:hypothetical protein
MYVVIKQAPNPNFPYETVENIYSCVESIYESGNIISLLTCSGLTYSHERNLITKIMIYNEQD